MYFGFLISDRQYVSFFPSIPSNAEGARSDRRFPLRDSFFSIVIQFSYYSYLVRTNRRTQRGFFNASLLLIYQILNTTRKVYYRIVLYLISYFTLPSEAPRTCGIARQRRASEKKKKYINNETSLKGKVLENVKKGFPIPPSPSILLPPDPHPPFAQLRRG